MTRIKVHGITQFVFHIKDRLIRKLGQGIEVYSESRNSRTIYTDPIEIPISKVAMKDSETLLIPPLELSLKAKITLKRDKSRGGGKKRR